MAAQMTATRLLGLRRSCSAPPWATPSTCRSWRRRSPWNSATSRTPRSTTRCRTRGGRPPRGPLAGDADLRHRPERRDPGGPLGPAPPHLPGERARDRGGLHPAFLAEARLSAESFRLWTWRAPEGRRLNYLEWILTRDSHVKEVKLFGLGPLVLSRYRALFRKFFEEDRRLAVRRMRAGILFGLLSLAAFYGCTPSWRAGRPWAPSRSATSPLHRRLPAGAGCAPGHPGRGRDHVRGRLVHVEPVRLPRHPDRRGGPARPPGALAAPRCSGRHRSSGTSPSVTPGRRHGRSGTSPSSSRPARSWASWARTGRASPRS